MFGFVRIANSKGNIWLLGSKDIEKIPKTFMKLCKIYLSAMLEDCNYLDNCVDASYTKAVRWLKKLGAEIYSPIPYGQELELFHYFRFQKKENNDV
jgi:hypothetical protein